MPIPQGITCGSGRYGVCHRTERSQDLFLWCTTSENAIKKICGIAINWSCLGTTRRQILLMVILMAEVLWQKILFCFSVYQDRQHTNKISQSHTLRFLLKFDFFDTSGTPRARGCGCDYKYRRFNQLSQEAMPVSIWKGKDIPGQDVAPETRALLHRNRTTSYTRSSSMRMADWYYVLSYSAELRFSNQVAWCLISRLRCWRRSLSVLLQSWQSSG